MALRNTTDGEPGVHIYWELNWLHQRDPKLIEFLRKKILIPPPSTNNNVYLNEQSLSTQHRTGMNGEVIAAEILLDLKTTGKRQNFTQKFFVEAGACDGQLISNSLYFEVKYNWTGLLVEPNPAYIDTLLSRQRNAWILPHCLSPKPYPVVVDFDAYFEMGGIINKENGVTKKPGTILMNSPPSWPPGYEWLADRRKTIKVQCFPLYSVLQALGNPKISYFSLDIEGAEYQVLKTIPWKNVDIELLGVEVEHAGKIFNGSEQDIFELLYKNGYKYRAKTKLDKFFKKMHPGEKVKNAKVLEVY